MKTRRLQTLATGLTVVLFAGVFAARAADFWWVNEDASGDFSASGNWQDADTNPGVPDVDDWALFEREMAAATTIVLDGTTNRTLLGLHVIKDKAILDLNGNDLALTAAASGANRSLMIGTAADQDHGDLNIQGGGTVTSAGLNIGFASGSTGVLVVDGSEDPVGTPTKLTVTGGVTYVGNDGSGTLEVRGGAEVSIGSALQMANRNALVPKSFVTVDGSGSKLTVGGNITIGGPADFVVQNGGEFVHNGAVFSVSMRGPNQFIIDNATATITGQLAVFRSSGDDNVQVNDGGVLVVGGDMNVHRVTTSLQSRGDVRVRGQNATGASAQHSEILSPEGASTLKIGGDLNMGMDASHGTAGRRFNLDVNEGGQVLVANALNLYATAWIRPDDGLIQANALLVQDHSEGNVDNPATDFARYVLTLREAFVGEPAQVQVVKDEVDAGGNVVLQNGTYGYLDLVLVMGEDEEENVFAPQIGQTFNVLSYEGTLSGHFKDRVPTGSSTLFNFEENGVEYRLDYGTGTNDAITLTVIPEPHTLGLLLAAGALLALRRRRG